jgi:cystathionine beta-synthase
MRGRRNPPVRSRNLAEHARILRDVTDAVGGTPLIALDRLAEGLAPRIVGKLESMNPGGSVKDRIGLPMIEAAEAAGLLKPGGVIVEPTSGNTGVGLAQAAAVRGYRCIFVMADKQSEEKRALLRAYGAEVVVCPTDVAPEDPRSYYSVSDRLTRETPGAWKPDQYSNPANPEAHYATTGPEIWSASGGRMTHFVAAIGTGGTISGVARYLREVAPSVQIVGADTAG